jgi:uncharacterized protein YabN with tetrapyrrole methylase and pyrophosphatase domain
VDDFRDSLAMYVKPGDSFPPLVSLSPAYRPDRKRCENYTDATGIVLQATEAERPLAYLTPGNPVTFDTVAQRILAAARTRSLRTLVVAGISSLDTVMADLEQEPAPGLHVFEASCFVGARVRPDTRFACLLMQIGVFGTNYAVIGREPRWDALAPLRDYLLQFYPRDHLVALVRSAAYNDQPASTYRVTLGALDHVPAHAQRGASLYIPAVSPPRLEARFHERMESFDNLKGTFTETSD